MKLKVGQKALFISEYQDHPFHNKIVVIMGIEGIHYRLGCACYRKERPSWSDEPEYNNDGYCYTDVDVKPIHEQLNLLEV